MNDQTKLIVVKNDVVGVSLFQTCKITNVKNLSIFTRNNLCKQPILKRRIVCLSAGLRFSLRPVGVFLISTQGTWI